MAGTRGLTQESLAASGRSSEKLSLPALQSKMKCDPDGYESELHLLYKQFNASVDLFEQQSALNFSSVGGGVGADPSVAKDLGDRAMFLAHVTPFYLKQLADFPRQLSDLLRSSCRNMPSGLRHSVAQALVLLMNRKIIGLEEMLSLFLEIQTLGDRNLRKLAFSHVVQSVRKMNQKHRNEAKNRVLQNVVFSMLQQDDEAKAKRALVTLCELHRRKVWFDERAANAICMACFHSSSRIMISALRFLLDYESIEDDNDSDASSSDDEETQKTSQVVINKESVYKAHHKGTTSSKKKKQAKLQRAIRSMKRQQRTSTENNNSTYYSPLNHLKDAQGYAEKLFSRLQTCNERFEIKMMMFKVIARTVGLHRLILLNFYPFIQKYSQPHQRDITNILAAAVQSCHDMVPPDAVEPLFKQIVNQFVHDRSRPEAIAVGLNVIREICLRMPLLMTEDLLQDLALYKKSHEKAVSAAARSLIVLFREVCPSLLVKKDRGRLVDPKARPKEYGEVDVLSNIPGVELLQESNGGEGDDDSDVEEHLSGADDDDLELTAGSGGDVWDEQDADDSESEDDDDGQESDDDDVDDRNSIGCDSETGISMDDEDEEEMDNEDEAELDSDDEGTEGEEEDGEEAIGPLEKDSEKKEKSNEKKRKAPDFDDNLLSAETSLRALKRLAEAKKEHPSDETDGILSNEDFQRIKELKAKKDAKLALARQGFKIPNSEQLSSKRVDPAKLEAHIKHKLTKEQRLELIKAGREDRGKYQARAAIKQKKTGGMSNRQKEHKKNMPLAAKRSKVSKSKQEKQRKQSRSGKQFRGRKAWK
ncbi:PREDICTED: protein SDA1 homolog [Tarenaya hassleriana]|uniref:protein SDA1 homolog n=1 Tax=Tarenaya hassleriana TaxID=28532 RepID=UPI00053C2C80|nr:PREDICTED: protein SDA1 homolog [Tarenaya hassleriana]